MLSQHLSPRRLTALVAAVIVSAAVLVACGGHAARAVSQSRSESAVSSVAVAGGDWLRFDYDAQRSGVGPANTGIAAANVGALQTRVVQGRRDG